MTSSAVAAAHIFPSISHAFDQAVTSLTKWQFHGSLADTTKQTVIIQLMKEHISREFRLDCSQAEQDRVAAVGLQTIPTRCSASLLCASPSPQTDNLSQRPLKLLDLMCPLSHVPL